MLNLSQNKRVSEIFSTFASNLSEKNHTKMDLLENHFILSSILLSTKIPKKIIIIKFAFFSFLILSYLAFKERKAEFGAQKTKGSKVAYEQAIVIFFNSGEFD